MQQIRRLTGSGSEEDPTHSGKNLYKRKKKSFIYFFYKFLIKNGLAFILISRLF